MQICIVNLLLYIVLYGEKYFDYQYEKSEIIIRRTYFSGWDICLLQQSGAKSGQQTGRSATLGGYTKFKGNILALTSITMGVYSVADGRMLARNGAVSMVSTNTINKP
jgi:hypothetical protein